MEINEGILTKTQSPTKSTNNNNNKTQNYCNQQLKPTSLMNQAADLN